MVNRQSENSSSRKTEKQSGGKAADRPAVFVLARDEIVGAELRENRQENRMELAFAEPPPADVRDRIRGAGFRWLAPQQIWVRPIPESGAKQAKIDAERLYGGVVESIRAERGAEGRRR